MLVVYKERNQLTMQEQAVVLSDAQNVIKALLDAGYRGAYPKRLLNEVPTNNEHFTYKEIFKAE